MGDFGNRNRNLQCELEVKVLEALLRREEEARTLGEPREWTCPRCGAVYSELPNRGLCTGVFRCITGGVEFTDPYRQCGGQLVVSGRHAPAQPAPRTPRREYPVDGYGNILDGEEEE
jgi:hypothetical protein